MGFWKNLFKNDNIETRSGLTATPPPYAEPLGGGGGGLFGGVTENRTLSLTAVWSAVQVISGAMGTFPLIAYQKTEDGKTKIPAHPLYKLLHDKPAPTTTSFQWKKLMTAQMLLHGAGISEIVYNSAGYPIELKILNTSDVTTAKTKTGDIVYHVKDKNGKINVKEPHQLLIFAFYKKIDGGWLSPLQLFRETFGESLTVREYGQQSFASGMRPAGIITGLKTVPDEASKQAIENYFSGFTAPTKRVLMLGEGVKFDTVSLNAEDMQYLESRKFSVSEIARIYNIPPIMLQDHAANSTWGTGISAITQGFINYTMLQHVTNLEEEINIKLASIYGDNIFAEFLLEGLLRGDTKERYEAYKIGASLGMYSVNELRAKENMNPIEGGDVRLIPLNFGTLADAINGRNRQVKGTDGNHN